MQGILFLGILLVIGIVLWIRSGGRPLEGFEDATVATPERNPDGTPVIPLLSPRDQTLLKGEVKPFAEPSTALLAAPPGQLASVGSRPQRDPAMETASAGRIQSVLESIKGFFDREAPGLSRLGDPSVQLPLSTAKGDRGRLEDELAVLKRNPGLESSLMVEDVNGMEANLGYLQKKWRLSANALSGSGAAEGFQDAAAGASGPSGILSRFASLFSGGDDVAAATSGPEGFQGASGSGSGAGSDMKQADLEDLALKINAEILRLSKSGTTDANINSRIDVLSTIKKTVDDLITEVKAGRRAERDIPIKKEDVTKFLPAMSNLNTGIPELITESGANPILNSLFSKYGAGDIKGADMAQQMFEQYAADFLKNLSYDVSLRFKYTGEGEQAMARDYAQAMADAKFVSENAMGGGVMGAGAPVGGDPLNPAVKSAYRGFFDQVIKGATGAEVEHIDVGMGAAAGEGGAAADGKPVPLERFSWKDRSKQICEQVAARGYSPREFGCMDDPEAVKQEGFSWRGYTRMICTRLGTIYDPGVPELCGCPPATWPGWKP
jgi:hypothetical protein